MFQLKSCDFILSNVFITSCSFLYPRSVFEGPSSSMVQDTCLGRMRSWVQIPAASPQLLQAPIYIGSELRFLRGYFFRTFFYFRFLKILVSLNSMLHEAIVEKREATEITKKKENAFSARCKVKMQYLQH